MEDMSREFAVEFFAELFRGRHHVQPNLKSFGNGWAVSCCNDLATWDSWDLTRLVFLAHETCMEWVNVE